MQKMAELSSESADNESSEKPKRQARPYQTELVEHALRGNTIVNLGTGAGKTFVAVMLIREMSHQTRGKFMEEEGGKRTIFLAHTVPLVKQQARYIRDNSDLKVQDFCGDSSGIDSWSQQKWFDLFDSNNVLVMSRQIFLDLLNRGIIKPRHLNLIIFDECHHATKNDPYVQTMKVIKDAPEEERPRILGLSASLLGTKVKPGELKKGVVGLETILMSRARTSKDLADVIKYATTPAERIANYSVNDDIVTLTLKSIINDPLKFFQTKYSDRRLKFPLGDVAKNLFEDLYSILMDLGPASAAGFVKTALKELKASMVTARCNNKYELGLATLGLTHLTVFDSKCQEFEREYGKLDDSNKVKTLLLVLGDISIQLDDDMLESEPKSPKTESKKSKKNELRGIIFVERRYTASCLSELLKRKRKEQQDLRHIRCDYVVGHNVGQSATSIRKEARMKSNKQEEILCRFRAGKISILIATSVIEEGVDVPKCNLVVRFDLPQNFRAYIQSKGRARNKPSLFYLLIGDHQMNKLFDIKNYQMLEKELILICQEDRTPPSEESIQEKMKDKIPPFMPDGREGARATLGNSLTILHRYCNKLPHDDYTKLAPIFEVLKIPKENPVASVSLYGEENDEDEDPNHDYICTLTLPMNCPIKGKIKSPPMGSKLQSHRAAARFAVEELYNLGELSDRFFPNPHSTDSDDEEIRVDKANDATAGTERRHWLYKNEISEYLKKSHPTPNEDVYLYAFVLRESLTNNLYSSSDSSGSHTMMGILTKKLLPYWKIPKFSLFVKGEEERETEVLVSLLPVPASRVYSLEELEVLTTCHQKIFSDLLQIVPPFVECDFSKADKDYLVVPLKITVMGGDDIFAGDVNFDVVSMIINPSEHEQDPWPCDLENYNNALVTVTHRETVSLPVGQELFKVTAVDRSRSPNSPFPTPQYESFVEYYKKKRNYQFKDLNQPALKACRIGVSSLKYLTSRYEGTSPTLQPKRSGSDSKIDTILFPEIVKVYPITASVFRLLKCLPSALWRLDSILLAEELAMEAQFGEVERHSETRIFTDTPLKAYTDVGHGSLSSQVLKYNGGTFSHKESDGFSRKEVFSRGPDNALLVQAMTPKGANDSVNLERLEILGDSLLKLASSIYLMNKLPDAHEGKLASARSRRVSNIKLFHQAKRKNLLGKILSNDLQMGSDRDSSLDRLRFLPPGYILKPNSDPPHLPHNLCPQNIGLVSSEEITKYLYHRFSDKMAADCMEALVGACTVAGGIEGGLRFMEWLDIGITMPNDVKSSLSLDHSFAASIDESLAPLIIAQSSSTFHKYFGSSKIVSDTDTKDREAFNRLLGLTGRAQQKIGYQFEHHCLLIEALTHLSYTTNSLTGCYHRLEFLGDAVLDYLITSHLYNLDKSMTPGTISSLKSALVCNRSLAEQTINMSLHKFILHKSPDLFKKINIYASTLKTSVEKSMEMLSLEDNDGEDDQAGSESEDDENGETNDDFDDDDDDDEEKVLLDPPKPLGDVFEALCGAVFLDTGMNLQKTWEVFGKFLEPKIKEYRHPNGGGIPINQIKQLYDLVPTGIAVKRKKVGKDFKCTITIEDKKIEVDASARNYKAAKTLAAVKALKSVIDTLA